MSKVYLRFSIYLALVVGIVIVPFRLETKEIKPLYHQKQVISVSLVQAPKKKKRKKIVKKTPKKVKKKHKPKPIEKPKPVVKKIIKPEPIVEPIKKAEPVIVKQEIEEPKKEVIAKEDTAQKEELARAIQAQKTYYDTIYDSIAEHKRYPKKARRYKQEGSIKVSFKVLSDGTIIDLKLLLLSKYKSLNRAVEKLFKHLEKFPRPPSNLSFPLELSITINYKLKR